jgi:hypothetical protein
MGLDLNYYWDSINPKQFEKHLKVWQQKEKNRAKEIDFSNFNLGQYILYAFNAPKKYPKKPFLDDSKPTNKVMTAEEMERTMQRITNKFK